MAKEPATNLVIVESPSKAKTIGKYLGPDYTVKACMVIFILTISISQLE